VRNGESTPVNLYIAYYSTQRIGSTIHSPSNCIPGGGWQIETSRTETVQIPSREPIKLTRLLIRQGDTAELVYYWLDERGRDLTENYSSKWYLFWDSIFMHRTDGALIRVITPLAKGEAENAAEQRLNRFLAAVLPQIKSYIPGAPEH
jgi:EpsI family protein